MTPDDHLADLVTTLGWISRLRTSDREAVEALADAFRAQVEEHGAPAVIAMKVVSLEAYSGHSAKELRTQ